MSKINGYELPGKRNVIPVCVCELNELLQLMGPKKFYDMIESIRVDAINEGLLTNCHNLPNGNYKRPGAAL